MVQLGKIVSTHGVRGLLRLRLFNPQSSTLTRTREVFLSKGPGALTPYEVLGAQAHGERVLLKLKGMESIEAAQTLVGCQLFVPESTLPELTEGEYYAYQLRDLTVVTTEGRRIGKVGDVLHTKANDILVVKAEGREHMIPLVDEVISQIDIQGGRIVVRLIEGLIE